MNEEKQEKQKKAKQKPFIQDKSKRINFKALDTLQ